MKLLVRSLKALLDADDFWSTVQSNSDGLTACLRSYFQFRPASDHPMQKQPSQDAKDLSKYMFMILSRLVLSEGKGSRQFLQGFLSLPLLMDAAALYYDSNPQMMRRIVAKALGMNDLSLAAQLPLLPQHLATQLTLLANECCSASSKIVVRIGGGGDALAEKSLSLIKDSLNFLDDMCYSLRAFISTHTSIAPALMIGEDSASEPKSGSALIAALADMHDRALTRIAGALSSPPQSTPQQSISAIQSHIRLLAFQLLRETFFVEITTAGDGEKAGEKFMVILMAAVQSNGESSKSSRSFLSNLNRAYELDVAVLTAMNRRTLILDEAQFDYLAAILGSDRNQAEAKARHLYPKDDGPSTSSSSTSAHADLSPLIAQVRDIMPHLGEGFITACLLHYDKKAEETINHLLEGSLHPSLASLDTSLASWNQQSSSTNSSSNQAATSSAWALAASDATQWQKDEARRMMESRSMARLPEPKQSTQSTRKVHKAVSRVLGLVDRTTRAMTRQLADRIQEDELAMIATAEEGEYDDEYDDSFDGLATTGIDGLADIEGEDNSRTAGGREEGMAMARPSSRAPIIASVSLKQPPRPVLSMESPSPSDNGGNGGGGRGSKGQGKGSKMWIFEGRIYHYAKAGAREVSGPEEANEVLKVAEEEKLHIYGLGPGGNKANNAQAQPLASDAQAEEDEGSHYPSNDVNRGMGGGRGGRGGRGPPNFARKEQNKAAIGNHHRKDQAMRKQGL